MRFDALFRVYMKSYPKQNIGESNGKIYPRTGHERPKGGVEVQLYSFFNLGTKWGWVFSSKPRPLYPPRKRPGTHWTGGRVDVDPRAGLDGCENSRPSRDSNRVPTSP